jgi:hypothetical protein
MNLVKVIENIEIERDNNKKLGSDFGARLVTFERQLDALLGQSKTFTAQLEAMYADVQKATGAVSIEIAERDKALAALIGGDE